MKKKVLLMIPLAFLMLFAAAAPVMAYNPKPCFSFAIGEVYVLNLTAPPPTVITTKTGEFVLGMYGIDYGYASILGYRTFNEEDWFYQSSTLTGYGMDIITSATSKEQDIFTINGLGPLTYDGPTFTYYGPTCDAAASGAQITKGDVFYGVLLTGSGSVQYTSPPLAGVDTWVGVIFADSTGIFVVTNCVN